MVIPISDVVLDRYTIIKSTETCWKSGVWKWHASTDSKSCSISKKLFMDTRYTSVLGKIIFIVTNNEAELSLWLLFFEVCIWFTHIIFSFILNLNESAHQAEGDNAAWLSKNIYTWYFVTCLILFSHFKKKLWVLNKLTILTNKCTLSLPERLNTFYLK